MIRILIYILICNNNTHIDRIIKMPHILILAIFMRVLLHIVVTANIYQMFTMCQAPLQVS